MKTPTHDEILNETDMTVISDEVVGQWRHGTQHSLVLRRKGDETFWRVNYQYQTNGDYNGLVEGDYSCTQVFPIQVTETRFVTTPPAQ